MAAQTTAAPAPSRRAEMEAIASQPADNIRSVAVTQRSFLGEALKLASAQTMPPLGAWAKQAAMEADKRAGGLISTGDALDGDPLEPKTDLESRKNRRISYADAYFATRDAVAPLEIALNAGRIIEGARDKGVTLSASDDAQLARVRSYLQTGKSGRSAAQLADTLRSIGAPLGLEWKSWTKPLGFEVPAPPSPKKTPKKKKESSGALWAAAGGLVFLGLVASKSRS